MKGIAGQLVAGIVIIAVLFVLVRPGTHGPGLVTAVSNGLSNLVKSATGGGSWAKG